jgi:hypothetical protein
MMGVLANIVSASRDFGVDLPWLLAFFVASLLSYFPVHQLVRNLHQRQFSRIVEKSRDKTLGGIEDEEKALGRHFDMEFAGTIGKAERIVYVFSVMYGNAFAVLSGWLVMKAFTKWLERKDMDETRLMRYYYLYLYGNLLSLLGGLSLGALGLAIQKVLLRCLS